MVILTLNMEDSRFSLLSLATTDRKRSALTRLSKLYLSDTYKDARHSTANTKQPAISDLCPPLAWYHYPRVNHSEKNYIKSYHSVHHSASIHSGYAIQIEGKIQGYRRLIAFKRAFVKAQHLHKICFDQKLDFKHSAAVCCALKSGKADSLYFNDITTNSNDHICKILKATQQSIHHLKLHLRMEMSPSLLQQIRKICFNLRAQPKSILSLSFAGAITKPMPDVLWEVPAVHLRLEQVETYGNFLLAKSLLQKQSNIQTLDLFFRVASNTLEDVTVLAKAITENNKQQNGIKNFSITFLLNKSISIESLACVFGQIQHWTSFSTLVIKCELFQLAEDCCQKQNLLLDNCFALLNSKQNSLSIFTLEIKSKTSCTSTLTEHLANWKDLEYSDRLKEYHGVPAYKEIGLKFKREKLWTMTSLKLNCESLCQWNALLTCFTCLTDLRICTLKDSFFAELPGVLGSFKHLKRLHLFMNPSNVMP